MNRRNFFGTMASLAAACGLDYSVMPALPAAEPEPVAKPATSGFTVIAKDDRGHVVIGFGSIDGAMQSGEVFATGCLLFDYEAAMHINEGSHSTPQFAFLPPS